MVLDEETNSEVAIKQTEKVRQFSLKIIMLKAILQENVICVCGPTSSKDRDAMLTVCERLKTPLLYGLNIFLTYCLFILFRHGL